MSLRFVALFGSWAHFIPVVFLIKTKD